MNLNRLHVFIFAHMYCVYFVHPVHELQTEIKSLIIIIVIQSFYYCFVEEGNNSDL